MRAILITQRVVLDQNQFFIERDYKNIILLSLSFMKKLDKLDQRNHSSTFNGFEDVFLCHIFEQLSFQTLFLINETFFSSLHLTFSLFA